MKYDAFISYSIRDRKLAESLVKAMERKGITMFDYSDLVPGDFHTKKLEEAIKETEVFLIILTESCLHSAYTKYEAMYAAELARKSGLRMLIIMPEEIDIPAEWQLLMGNVQRIVGPIEEAAGKAADLLADEKKERKKNEILNRSAEYYSAGDYWSAEMDLNLLLQDPVYENDPDVNFQLAFLWEDIRLYYHDESVTTDMLIDRYSRVIRFGDRIKHKVLIENAEQAIERLKKEAKEGQKAVQKESADEAFVLAVITSRMETAERFEQLMGSAATPAELNCLLTDYTQIINFCSVFTDSGKEISERIKQCRDKIQTVKEQLNTGVDFQKETKVLRAYRSYLGLSRPEYPMYDVFISFKSEDEKYATQVYDFLLLKGKRPFFSKENISALGNSEYHDAIMGALDHSKHFILVSSSMEHLNSSWVKHEWSTYVGEAVEGRKNGNMVLVFHEDFHYRKEDLPIDIRRKEIISLSSFRDRLADYMV